MDKKDKEYYRKYIIDEGLDKIVAFKEDDEYSEGVYDTVSGTLETPFRPEPEDLVRLHKLIRQRKSFTILEFGLGYSTIIMADALRKNKQEWQNLDPRPEIRNRFMFQLFSVDASKRWIEHTKSNFPQFLEGFVNFLHSEVSIGLFNGQICHYYDSLPDIVPDFVYLDGPSPKDVKGSINGLSFQCDERTVMSGDLLRMEPIFLPGTCIVVDGRTNNARFLERNFKRKYKIIWDREGDVTTMELDEERLGPYNLLGSDFF